IVSPDSGGPRGVSQLTILARLMHRLNYDSRDDQIIRPCDVFDMIGGTGTGGVIAILLVTLRLTVREALDEFIDLCATVLDKQDVDAETRTAALKQYIDGLLERRGIDRNTRIYDPNDHSVNCKLAIPISYKRHAGSICMLRNYSVRKEETLDLTIAEALMATLATPPMFTPIQILKESATFEYIGADWTLSNSTEEIIAEAYEVLGAEQRVACLLSLGCGSPGVFTAPLDSSIAAWNKFLENLITDSEQKAKGIDSRMGHLGFYHRFTVSSGFEKASTLTSIRLGDTVTHTQVYLDDPTVLPRIDACAESLQIRDGVSSLEQIRHTGGRVTLCPQLPPLTRSFVMRREPWEFIEKILLHSSNPDDADEPKILVITGIGGCGKTQLMLKFMKEYRSKFKSRFFIDGSSPEQIRADILRNVRAPGAEHSQKSFEDCLLFLSQPLASGTWLLVYDNVDAPDLDLSSLLPRGSCAITITSRNGLLGDLHPEGHLRLDIMELDEAIDLLLYGHGDLATTDQARIDATAIAEALGRLPIALQQARAYMRQTKCSARAYLERLSKSREKVLRQPIKYQLNSRAISTYAAFETSFSRLPENIQKVLRLLSYFHWNGFPLELVTLGAKYQFSEYQEVVAPDADTFYIGKSLLKDIFLIHGEWDVTNLDTTMLSLQNYSLVSLISGVDTLLLQMHPLVHEWVRLCVPENEGRRYQSAATLLLALGARDDRTAATQYLSSHVTHMSARWKHLDLNNASAFRSILAENGLYQGAVELQEMVIEELRRCSNAHDETLSRSLRVLASLYRSSGRLNEAEVLQQEVLRINKDILGERHPNTIAALNNLANTYSDLGKLSEAEAIQREVLRLRKEILGEKHSDTIMALNNLANTYNDLGKLAEAEAIQQDVLKLRKETLGERHPDTIMASHNLANTYNDLGKLAEAEAIQQEVLRISKEILGERHLNTIVASNNLANTYSGLGKLAKAEAIQQEVLRFRKEILGERHPNTIIASANLAITYRDLGRLAEAETLFLEALKSQKIVLGEHHPSTTNVSHELAITYCASGLLDAAKDLLEQVLKDRRLVQGERHLHTIHASSDLAAVLRLQGNLPEAEALSAEVLRLRLELLGNQHHDTQLASYRLAAVYYDQGRLNEAEARLLGALDSMRNILGSNHHKTTATMLLLAKVYCSLNRFDDARELVTAAETIISETLGNAHPQYFEAMEILSRLPVPNSEYDANSSSSS
ncbi:hypothetical protein M408DRAFT_75716, partial [Serendipita vermifera MAFF 305830]